jgi:signal transduction histidine kinase
VGEHAALDLLEDAAEAVTSAAKARGVTVAASGAPGLLLRCDRERVHRVLANLLLNAIRASPRDGRVEVTVREAGGDAVFAVRDEGPGISDADLRRVFDRYFRARGAEAGGVGLGLSIVKAIVERHGGRVWVESAPGRGSTFAFALPTGGPAQAEAGARARANASQE